MQQADEQKASTVHLINLVRIVLERFLDREFDIGGPRGAVAVFPTAHREVGAVRVFLGDSGFTLDEARQYNLDGLRPFI
jgi:hypothetical protein